MTVRDAGRARTELTIATAHLNPHGVMHGAMPFSLAEGESCAATDLQLNFLRLATSGTLVFGSTLVHRGRGRAHLDGRLGERLLATATGNFAAFARRAPPGLHQAPPWRRRLRYSLCPLQSLLEPSQWPLTTAWC